MKDSLISIIIPAYNSEKYILETLDSICIQTYKNWECIIVDDGSTDGGRNIIHDFAKREPKIRIHKRPKEKAKGANSCRNYGLSISNGDYILFMDADDCLSSTCLERRIKLITKSTKDVIVFSTQEFFQQMGDGKYISNKEMVSYTQELCLKMFLSGKFMWTIMGVLWPKGILTINPFDEELQRFQDVDFHIKILQNDSLTIDRVKIIDNYHRQPLIPKKSDLNFRLKVIHSFIHLLNSFDICLFNKYQKEIRNFTFTVCNRFVAVHGNNSEIGTYFINELKLNNNLFSRYDLLLLRFHIFTKLKGVGDLKSIGVHRFNKILKKRFSL